jgi:hypothetical protein
VQSKAAVAVVAFAAGLAGVFGTSYMIGGHDQDHIVEVLIPQFIVMARWLPSLLCCFFVDGLEESTR